MTSVAWILVILFSIMLVLTLMLLHRLKKSYRDHLIDQKEDSGNFISGKESHISADEHEIDDQIFESLTDRKESVVNEEIRIPQKADETDEALPFEEADEESVPVTDLGILEKGIEIAWPESRIMMKKIRCSDALVYIFEGICKTENVILFDLSQNAITYQVLESVKKISDENSIPEYRPVIVIRSQNTGEAKQKEQISTRLRELGKTPVLVFSDSGFAETADERLAAAALITIGKTAYAALQYSCPSETAKKILAECEKETDYSIDNQTASELYAKLKKSPEASVRKALSSISRKQSLAAMVQLIPESRAMVKPVFRMEDTNEEILLYAADDEQLEDALDSLRGLMQENGYQIYMKEQRSSGSCSGCDSIFYQRLEKALKETAGYTHCLPVLSNADYTWKGAETFSVSVRKLSRKQIYELIAALIG